MSDRAAVLRLEILVVERRASYGFLVMTSLLLAILGILIKQA